MLMLYEVHWKIARSIVERGSVACMLPLTGCLLPRCTLYLEAGSCGHSHRPEHGCARLHKSMVCAQTSQTTELE